jgi:hypothetical protein
MKKKAIIITFALLLCAFTGSMALAKSKFHTISFDQNTMVDGTLVKKGEYQARFNEQTGEFVIANGKHTVLTTKAREQMLDKKAPETTYDLKAEGNDSVLTKVTFGGEHYSLMFGDNQSAEGQ